VSRAFGTIDLAGLPDALVPPALWEGQLVRLTGWTDRVSAESGTGTSPPAVTAAGTIRYWTGEAGGYAELAVDQLTPSGFSVPVEPLTLLQDFGGGPVEITMTPALTVGGSATLDSAPSPCAEPCTRTEVEARARSPLVGTIAYVARHNGVTVADLTITVNLGTLLGKASYIPAPAGA